ncbi:fibroleukin-like [Saccostrea cucullata]|uniref:fibroleukin-like n=1 Tax=Saccostrea cuccullata TaxID=36930 RepID=UPI002ED47D98
MSNLCFFCLIVVIFTVSQGIFISRKFIAKLEFDDKFSNNELLGEYNSKSLIECGIICQRERRCSLFGYNTRLKKCRIHHKAFTSGTSNQAGWRYMYYQYLPVDCKDLHDCGNTNSGVYEIYPLGARSIRVYCDMMTQGGGWTVIQKRVSGSLSFNRNWAEYKNGFGDPEQNMWIGNDVIHQLTKNKDSHLYVSITTQNGTKLYQLYYQFNVSSETEKFKIFLSGDSTGTLGDSMVNTALTWENQSGMYFSTPDNDNDNWENNCAAFHNGGGWWFNNCHQAFLNGPWTPVEWKYPWNPPFEYGTSVYGTLMMVRRG